MKICIDPGHGGADSGAIAALTATEEHREKDINLSASFMLAGILISLGHKVVLTRSKDGGLPLGVRTDIANHNNCDVFISVHCNSFTQPEPRGFEVYNYSSSLKGGELSLKISKEVGQIDWLFIHGKGNKLAEFYVLSHTQMPAVLVELSFMSNPDDMILLLNPDNLFTIMRKIGSAIHEWGTTSL